MKSVTSEEKLLQSFQSYSRSAGILIPIFALSVLAGWFWDIALLKSLHPSLVTVKTNTALCFLLIGISLWLQRREHYRNSLLISANILAGLVTSIGLLTLLEYWFGWNLGIDEFLFKEAPGAVGTSHPNRMAPNTALNFVFCGLALLCLHHQSLKGRSIAQYLTIIPLLISHLALIGYLFGAQVLSGLAPYTNMALTTAIAFHLVFIAIFFFYPDRGLAAIFTKNSMGGILARRLLPPTILTLILSGWIRMMGQQAGYYNTAFGAAMMIFLTIVILSGLILRFSRYLHNVDIKRIEAETELCLLNESLNQRTHQQEAQLIATNTQLQKEIEEKRLAEELTIRQNRVLSTTNKVLSESLLCESDKEIANTCLEHTQELTKSVCGFIGLINESGRFDAIAISEQAWSAGMIPQENILKLTTNMELRGLWAQALLKKQTVIINDPGDSPSAIGVPEGHIPISSLITVPMLRADSVVGAIVLANKPGGYEDADQKALEFISQTLVVALYKKRAEIRLNQLNDELEQRVQERTKQLEVSNRELEAFCYSVSHDLRAPLRALDGFSQILLEDYCDKLDQQGQDYLQRIRSASQQMAQLIDTLLTLSRITRAEMKHEEVDLSHIAGQIVQNLRQVDPEREVEIEIESDIQAAGDPQLLQVVLDNLISNAWKFSSKKSDPKIEFGIKQNGRPQRVYYLRDNGAGFDMKYQKKLFAPFQRLHTKSQYPGTGVGLATVQRIIQKHGGEIWAESVVDQGATFYFTLNNHGGET